jgi:thioredoxin-related protein
MNKKLINLFSVLIIWIPLSVFSQLKQYSFTEIDSLLKTEQQNTVVFIHTDWCKFCKLMEKTTFKNREIISLLNEKFLFVSLNAEQKLDINFKSNNYKFKPFGVNTGLHELAEQLATKNGKIAYPTICILNADYEIIFQHNQYINSDDFLNVLKKLI